MARIRSVEAAAEQARASRYLTLAKRRLFYFFFLTLINRRTHADRRNSGGLARFNPLTFFGRRRRYTFFAPFQISWNFRRRAVDFYIH